MTAALALLAVLLTVPFRGVDTRDGRDWQPGLWGPGLLR